MTYLLIYFLFLQFFYFFFFYVTATTEIYTLSLHDALPISPNATSSDTRADPIGARAASRARSAPAAGRSEEHTSELQSHSDLVCRLLLEKKKNSQRQQQGSKKKI